MTDQWMQRDTEVYSEKPRESREPRDPNSGGLPGFDSPLGFGGKKVWEPTI